MSRKTADNTHSRTLSALDGLPLFASTQLEGAGGVAEGAAEDAPPGGGTVGLSSCHICPQAKKLWEFQIIVPKETKSEKWIRQPEFHTRTAKISIAVGGNVVRLRGPELSGDMSRAKSLHRRDHVRGTIKEFSKGSRMRLLTRLQEVDQRRLSHRPLMVTLTYPANWPVSPEVWKSDLRSFVKRLRRRYPAAAIIWRLEAQERGAPHYHLLVFGVRFLPHEWVGEAWADITKGNAEACSQVERVRSWRGVVSYASKYLAKLDDRAFRAGAGGEELVEVGRLWGVINADGLPTDVREWALTMQQFFNLRRLLYRYLNASRRAAGKKGRRRPRDATAGVSAFLGWYAGAQAVEFHGGGASAVKLALETLLIEQDARELRRLVAEFERERRGHE